MVLPQPSNLLPPPKVITHYVVGGIKGEYEISYTSWQLRNYVFKKYFINGLTPPSK